MEKKGIISDLTLSAAEGVAETKAKSFWENRMKPYEKVRFLAGHFDCFIEYNSNMFRRSDSDCCFSDQKDIGVRSAGRIYGRRAGFQDALRGKNILWVLLAKPELCVLTASQRCLYANTFYLGIIGRQRRYSSWTGCWTTTTGFLPTVLIVPGDYG